MSDLEEGGGGYDLGYMFVEPPRLPSPEPTVSIYTRELTHVNRDVNEYVDRTGTANWTSVSIRLVGEHPLWGHYLWNAARSFATYLDVHADGLCQGKAVLELGAGGGLPGLVCALNGARKVVLTDYPDASLLENLKCNVEGNVPVNLQSVVDVVGYVWGKPIDNLLATLPRESDRFDLIILSDLIFNHSQHDALLDSCERALSSDVPSLATSEKPSTPCLLVFYSHHRPRFADQDLDFFRKARERGWICDKIVTQMMEVMFPDDPGDEQVRGTVHGWRLWRGGIE